MYIADELCDRVGFIVDGRLVLIDSPKNLKLQYGEKFIEVEYVAGDEIIKESLSFVNQKDIGRLKIILDTYPIQTMHTKEATLEEILIKVTGRGLV
jgi:fluoroquinolone transport system ATP-binding protein